MFLPKNEVYRAARVVAQKLGEDDDDLRLLAGKAGFSTAAEVLDLVERVASPRHLTAQVRFFVEAAMDPTDEI